jgi:hypothetical protein
MKLEEYLYINRIRPVDFAKEIGVNFVTIYRTMNGSSIPRPKLMQAIHAKTEGKVGPADFYALGEP